MDLLKVAWTCPAIHDSLSSDAVEILPRELLSNSSSKSPQAIRLFHWTLLFYSDGIKLSAIYYRGIKISGGVVGMRPSGIHATWAKTPRRPPPQARASLGLGGGRTDKMIGGEKWYGPEKAVGRALTNHGGGDKAVNDGKMIDMNKPHHLEWFIPCFVNWSSKIFRASIGSSAYW